MKTVYLTSGFNQSYPHQFIDRFIISGLEEINEPSRVVILDSKKNWHQELIKTIEEYEPDLVFTIHGGYMKPKIVQLVQRRGCKFAIWFVDDPYDIGASLEKLYNYDFIFTNEKEAIPFYKGHGFSQVHFLPLGVQPKYYFPESVSGRYRSDISFVGSPFPNRIGMIKYLLSKLQGLRIILIGPYWNKHLGSGAEIIAHPLGPDEIRKFYNGAAINLNIHREATEHLYSGNLNPQQIPAHSPNNRIFDIGACNAFQLVDERLGLKDFYNESQLATFHNKQEMIQRIDYYLHHPEGRKRLARNTYQKTLAAHQCKHRLSQMIHIVKKVLYQEVQHLLSSRNRERSSLIRTPNGAVYYLFNGKKYLIANVTSFEHFGFRWDQVQPISFDQANALPTGIKISMG